MGPRDRRRKRLRTIGAGIGRLAAAVLPLFGLGGTSARAAEALDLGVISGSPSEQIKLFTPLDDYLTGKGLPMGRIVTAETVGGMIELLRQGKVDFLFESPYGAVQIMEATGAVPVLIREKDGIRDYNSVIFVKADSPVRDVGGLAGKILAFEDPESTSAYVLPKTLLLGLGLEVVESDAPVPGKVAYYFARQETNVLAHVRLGRADAGGIDKAAVADQPRFRTLTPESGHVPRHVLLVRAGVDYRGLKKALLGMAADPGAAEVLNAVETPTGFSEFDGEPRKVMDGVKASLGL